MVIFCLHEHGLENYVDLQLMFDNKIENQLYKRIVFCDNTSGYEYLRKAIEKVTGFNHQIISLIKLILEQCPRKRLHNEGVF